MHHQYVPPGIHISHPRSKLMLNHDRMCDSHGELTISIPLLIDALKAEPHRVKGLLKDVLLQMIEGCGHKQAWKDEQTAAVEQALPERVLLPWLSLVTISSHQQPDGSKHGRCNVLGNHMGGEGL